MAQTVSLLLSAEHSADVQGIIEDRAAVFGVKRLDGAMACGPLVWR
jgi:hypothetical protein